MLGNRRILGAILVSMLLAGCAGQSEDGSRSEISGPAGPGTSEPDPVALIGSWTIAEAAQEEPGAVLRIAPDDLSVWRECGTLTGSWRADTGGLFIADVQGANGCTVAEAPTPEWLRDATGFRIAGADRLLLNAGGDVVARLLPGAKLEAGPDMLPEQAEPPVVTEEARRAFAASAPLPAGLNPPPAPEALIGRWVPASGPMGTPEPAYVELRSDGTWQGSDGCNGQAGRWVAGAGGSLLATSGMSTLIGCDNVAIAEWLTQAWQAGLDGTVLVLVDAQGKETGRVTPAG